MQRFLIASCLTVGALADPGVVVPPIVGGNVLVGPGGLSPAWPAVAGLGVESTCFGCRPFHILGKRSADPAIHPEGPVLTHNNNLYSGFTGNHYATGLPGHSFAAVTHLGKRSAEPGLFAAGYGFTNGPASVSAVGNHFASNYGVSQLHPGPASSFQRVDRLHKRSADPHGVAVGVGLLNNNVHGLNHHFGTAHGISQLHPGASSSFQQTTRLHKRAAEPFGFAVPIGIRDNNLHGAGGSFIGISQLHPGGHSFQHVDRLRKRSAEPHGFGHFVGIRDNNLLGAHLPVVSSVGVSQLHPGAASSFQHVDRIV